MNLIEFITVERMQEIRRNLRQLEDGADRSRLPDPALPGPALRAQSPIVKAMKEQSMTRTIDDRAHPPQYLAEGSLAQLAPIATSAYFLDVDGTLLDIQPNPGDVVADAELQKLLLTLHEKLDGALALVSGRTIEDIDRIFEPLRLPAAGTHGAMLRFGDGSMAGVTGAPLRVARQSVEAFVAARPGLLFEDKGAALTVHFRHKPDLRSEVLALLETYAEESGLVVLEGKMVAELKLAEFNKGTAIGTFMGLAPFSGRKPVFIGDDITDEYGFTAVNKMDGLSIRVDRVDQLSQARFRLLEPAALRAQLRALLSST